MDRVAQLALGLALLLPAAGAAGPGYSLRKVALSGDLAPGTPGEVFALVPTPEVAIDAAGHVALRAALAGAPEDSGAWSDLGSGLALRLRNGEPAPGTGGGSYFYSGGKPSLDAAGRVSLPFSVTGGTSPGGLFRDAGGPDAALLVAHQPAPADLDATLDLDTNDLYSARMNAAGALVFTSRTTGDEELGSGVFVREPDGAVRVVARSGDSAPGTGGFPWSHFAYPVIDAAGRAAFYGAVPFTNVDAGVFAETESGIVPFALAGQVAPGTGGKTFAWFMPAARNADGAVFFFATLNAPTDQHTYLADGSSITAVTVPSDPVAAAGGVPPASANVLHAGSDGSLLVLAEFEGGTTERGILVRDAGGSELRPVVLAGQALPGTGGATPFYFPDVARSESGEIAFVAQLDDERWGVFVASPLDAPEVPALPGAVGALGALAIALAARPRPHRRV